MSQATKSNITALRIRQLFDYDPLSGEFKRKSDRRIVTWAGLKVDGEAHEVSRYIWLYYYGGWPPLNRLVDHKDRNHNNNIISNLRLATHPQNGYNMKHYNPSGYKGITYQHDRSTYPWQAQIRINGRKTNLGRYETKEEAAEAYRLAAIAHHGVFLCL